MSYSDVVRHAADLGYANELPTTYSVKLKIVAEDIDLVNGYS